MITHTVRSILVALLWILEYSANRGPLEFGDYRLSKQLHFVASASAMIGDLSKVLSLRLADVRFLSFQVLQCLKCYRLSGASPPKAANIATVV